MRILKTIIVTFLLVAIQETLFAVDDVSLLKEARKGSVPAMRQIGMRMYKGCSIGNPTFGIKWLRKAADQGDTKAMYRWVASF